MSKKHSSQSHDFAQAVKEIPTLIVEEIKRNERAATDTHENTLSEKKSEIVTETKHYGQSVYRSPRHSRRWMFIGVILCTVCIFGFWLVYISDLIHQNKSTLNPISTFTNGQGTDVSMLINTFNTMENDAKEKLKSPDELKAMVASAILPFITASSSPTSTDQLPITATTTKE